MEFGPITPVILAGGTGSRLWPVSRAARPKQFAALAGDDSLLAETVRRLEDAGCGQPMFVTNEAYRWAVVAEADALGLSERRIVLEPAARNTAPAIAAAAQIIAEETPEALLLVSPSDHLVNDTLAFASAIARGAPAARAGEIVTFGIVPSRAETGFGYISVDQAHVEDDVMPIHAFVEKPGHADAEDLISGGCAFWNAGIFLASAATLCRLFRQLAPDVADAVSIAVGSATLDLEFLRLGAEYSSAPPVPFDKAVMERTGGVVVKLDAGWSDIGSWQGVWAASQRDADNNLLSGTVQSEGSRDSLLMSTDRKTHLVGIGLKHVAAIATRDAVLVVDMDHAQSVSAVVKKLSSDGIRQSDVFARDDRPWGYFETLAQGPRFQVKSIVVKPGGQLSLQSHEHRAEHWIVVEGTATVTIGDTTKLVTENQSVYIPLGTRHRLKNEGRQPLRLIEVQTGTYLGEDDIVRYQDVYQRL